MTGNNHLQHTVEKTNKRIPELDDLRGAAILLVISFHYLNNQLVDNTDSISRSLAKITSFGWVGVDLFFVLSGIKTRPGISKLFTSGE